MKINKLIFLLLMLLWSRPVVSQSFEWIRSEHVKYTMNPSYPEFAVAYDEANQQVVHSRIDSVVLIYGTTVFGTTLLEARDAGGQVNWSLYLGEKANVQRIVADANGHVYAGGTFQETLHIGPNDSMTYIPGMFTGQNTFIIKLDASGNLLWKRNITATWPDVEGIEAMAIDPSGSCWYAQSDFFVAHITEIDGSGNDMTTHLITNGKRIGNISFDPWGGLFVSGAAESGNFIMNADTFQAAHSYNMFIARFDQAGQPSWAYFGEDITFQKPMVIADGLGNAFFAGSRFIPTSFNGAMFSAPYLSGDFFGFSIDTSGTINWILQQPPLGMPPFGIFQPGSNRVLAADSAGRFYMGGLHRGTVDWGNGFLSTTGNGFEYKIAIACINGSGVVQWVKTGGGSGTNHMHALDVSESGTCYFTGAFGDTAVFDSIFIPTGNFYNFALGKIHPASVMSLDEHAGGQITLYPNPGNGIVTFTDEMENAGLRLFDGTGRIVYQVSRLEKGSLDVRHIPAGLYTFEISQNERVYHVKYLRIE